MNTAGIQLSFRGSLHVIQIVRNGFVRSFSLIRFLTFLPTLTCTSMTLCVLLWMQLSSAFLSVLQDRAPPGSLNLHGSGCGSATPGENGPGFFGQEPAPCSFCSAFALGKQLVTWPLMLTALLSPLTGCTAPRSKKLCFSLGSTMPQIDWSIKRSAWTIKPIWRSRPVKCGSTCCLAWAAA